MVDLVWFVCPGLFRFGLVYFVLLCWVRNPIIFHGPWTIKKYINRVGYTVAARLKISCFLHMFCSADLIGESLPTGAKIFIYFVPLTIAVLAILIPLYRERTSKAIEDFKLDFKLNASDELLDNITNGVIKAVEFYKAVQ